jgi:hypothetical protein
VGIPPLSALYLQLSENTHMQVPPHEEAHAYTLLFRLVRQADEEFSLAQFARKVGRSPETVRNAIHFSELPISVQDYVAKGFVPYGIGVELTRLRRSGMKKSRLDWWALRAATERKKVPEFRELVTKYLVDQNSGQFDLLGIVTLEEEKLQRRLHIKRTVEANVIQAIWSWIHYFQKVRSLFDEGKLGLPDSPFSSRSPRRIFLALVDEMEKVLPHFRKIISLRMHAEISNVLGQAREAVRRLDSVHMS